MAALRESGLFMTVAGEKKVSALIFGLHKNHPDTFVIRSGLWCQGILPDTFSRAPGIAPETPSEEVQASRLVHRPISGWHRLKQLASLRRRS